MRPRRRAGKAPKVSSCSCAFATRARGRMASSATLRPVSSAAGTPKHAAPSGVNRTSSEPVLASYEYVFAVG
jgi:hypothetical protein